MKIRKSLQEIQESANKYNKRNDFAKKDNAAYQTAKRMGLLNEVCSHMELSKTRMRTLEEIKKEAKKYTRRSDFQKGSGGAYQAALKRLDFDNICLHMDDPLTESYSLEEIKKEANKYNKRGNFKKGNSSIYNAAKRRPDFDDICLHMDIPINEAYTIEEIQEKANLCDSRAELYEKYPSIYAVAHKREDYGQICAHMKPSNGSSRPEMTLFELVKNKYPKTQKMIDCKVFILGKPHIRRLEIDIYVPELRKGIEFDGRYHHSYEGLKRGHPTWPDEDIKNYHQLKDGWFLSKGIQILHIKEEDWKKDKETCIKKCLNFIFNE